MKKQNNPVPQDDIKPDLKHDSMEYSAATDGDDKLDTDDETYEEEEITAEELDILEEDDTDLQAEALDSAETDKMADENTLPEENWLEDIPDTKSNDHKNHYRNKKHSQ